MKPYCASQHPPPHIWLHSYVPSPRTENLFSKIALVIGLKHLDYNFSFLK